jgi:hypothetical protein
MIKSPKRDYSVSNLYMLQLVWGYADIDGQSSQHDWTRFKNGKV